MLLRTERRFERLPHLKQQYIDFMDNYQELGHMRQAPLNCSPARALFLPQHGIFKTHGDPSKLRVVFNGSVKLSSGFALNDCLYSGPKLQLDIMDILLTWRKHKFVFTADIKQMFRQIFIAAEDQSLQQILWRTSEKQPIQPFYLTTVTYGLASSPYQAIRTLLQLASDEEQRFPQAAEIVRTSRYVDDILVGADSIPEVLRLKDELIQLLKAGGFPLSKWTSNSMEILSTVPPMDRAAAEAKTWTQPETSDIVRTLGVSWQPKKDIFTFNFDRSMDIEKPTKRSVLSATAQLYDPVGWIVPFTVSFTIFMQRLWHTRLQWDDPLPHHLQERWKELALQLPDLELISIPRWLGYAQDIPHVELHGFSDASERAYAACVYLRTINSDGHATSALILSKFKVAHLKQVSLPRLELCGALVLVRLTKRIKESLSLQSAVCHLWSDSTITLAWIRERPSTWKTYIANRVSDIQTTLPQAAWHHVPGKLNPADLASRGISAGELAEASLWFQGPFFLTDTSDAWPSTLEEFHDVESPEIRRTTCLTACVQSKRPPMESDLLKQYSSLKKLLKTTAWCLHYIGQLRRRRNSASLQASPPPALTPLQLNDALFHWIHYVQHLHYAKEITLLQAKQSISATSTLIKLHPIVDESKILRVGGRLRHSLLHPGEIHPVILPRESYLTCLLVADAHTKTLHGGVQLTLNFLRQRFWIVRGRQFVKSFISQCHRCWRHRAKPTTQLMGDLPLERVQRFRAFLHTGVDYAGPIHMRLSKGRGTKSHKGYISVFVCLATRAVHLAALSGYSTEDFLLAFRRFNARRGRCALLTSDCGTNFVGADKELRSLFQQYLIRE